MDERSRKMDWAHEHKPPFVDLEKIQIPPEALAMVQATTARVCRVLPLKCEARNLWVAMEDPYDRSAIDAVMEDSGCKVNPVICVTAELDKFIQTHYATH